MLSLSSRESSLSLTSSTPIVTSSTNHLSFLAHAQGVPHPVGVIVCKRSPHREPPRAKAVILGSHVPRKALNYLTIYGFPDCRGTCLPALTRNCRDPMSSQRNLSQITVNLPSFNLPLGLLILFSQKLSVVVLSVAATTIYSFSTKVSWPRNS
jgi:hypothetical protein